MTINRYLGREIVKPFVPILAILVALFASYNTAAFLSDAANGLLPTDTITALVALKVLISMEVLIPVALYVSVLLSFGRLHGDLEFTAMLALRLSPRRVMGVVLALSASLALVVAMLSLFVRPWAYQRLHELSRQAEDKVDVNSMEAGTFYQTEHGDRVVFFAHRRGPGTPADDVFLRLYQGDQMQVVHARHAYLLPQAPPATRARIFMRDADVYTIGTSDPTIDQIVQASGMFINLDGHDTALPGYSSVAASSARLSTSATAQDTAELQWRLSTPLSTLLLGLLGIPMSRPRRNRSRNTMFAAAILFYCGYYLLFTSARTWVQHGAIASFPGIWWVPALLGLFLLSTLYGPARSFERHRA